MVAGKRKTGPWVKKLAIRKFSVDAVPPGGGIADGINALRSPDMPRKMAKCFEWAFEQIDKLRNAHNDLREFSDEQVAQLLVEAIKQEYKRSNPDAD